MAFFIFFWSQRTFLPKAQHMFGPESLYLPVPMDTLFFHEITSVPATPAAQSLDCRLDEPSSGLAAISRIYEYG